MRPQKSVARSSRSKLTIWTFRFPRFFRCTRNWQTSSHSCELVIILPAHVILPEPMGPTGGNMPHGQDAGFLGKAYDPFVLNADPSKKDFKVPDLLPPAEIGEARLQRRRELREVVDSVVKDFEASPSAQLMDANFASAYRLMTSEKAREAFDLEKEPQKVRERYGMTRFGQCCLLARRLVESGVRFVTINTFITVFDEISWDIHG